MTAAALQTDWISRFKGLSRLGAETRARLLGVSEVAAIPRGAHLFGPGQTPDKMLFLLEGTVRVYQSGDTGREIFLYRVHAGESCVLTTACLLAQEDYAADGEAETNLVAALVPRREFDALLGESAEFRRFVFDAYARRIADLFMVIEEISFRRVDARLAAKLLAMADGSGAVSATHQMLAAELGTAREVVSRILTDFQRKGWIEQGRGRVTITAHGALTRLGRS